MNLREALAVHHDRAVRAAVVAERAERDRAAGRRREADRLDSIACELAEGLPPVLRRALGL
ncbi:MAG: hypothetical protein ACRC4O_10955 [Giesbergeria sp.]